VGGWLLEPHEANALPTVFGPIDAALARSRAEAPRLLEELLPLAPEERLARLHADPRFVSWGLCELLARRSCQTAAEKPSEAVHLADLAVHVADRIAEGGLFEKSWGAVCNRIPYFSDPNRTVDSQTIGTAWNFATALGRNQVVTYAQFWAQSTNAPPGAHFTKSCTNLTCTFDASTSTDDTIIPETGYWWDFGDGATGAGRTISHTYNPQVAARVHLVVTDSGGQTDVEWQASWGRLRLRSNQISLTWTASTGSTSYEVRRKSDGGFYQTVAAPSGNSFTDTVSSNRTYVYSVRALNASGASGWSAPDLATTFFFTDDPATAGGIIKAGPSPPASASNQPGARRRGTRRLFLHRPRANGDQGGSH
jgi:hypothetical protein